MFRPIARERKSLMDYNLTWYLVPPRVHVSYRPQADAFVKEENMYKVFWAVHVSKINVTRLSISRPLLDFNRIRGDSGAPAAEGRQAEPHTHIRELKGTHELIFSCVPWLAVLLVGAYARRRRRRRRWSRATWRPYSNNRLTETCSLGLLVLL